MTTVFTLCKRLIEIDKAKGGDCSSVIAKMDVYLANDRLTIEEYDALIEIIKG